MKVTVRIHRATGLDFQTKKIDDDGKITLRKKSRDHAGWRVGIGSLESKHGYFGRVKFYADIFPNATETWTYDYDVPDATKPKWDKDQSHKFISAKILEKAAEEPKEKGTTGTLLLAVLIIVGIVINILLISGRLRI
jgi:hypothetical protein